MVACPYLPQSLANPFDPKLGNDFLGRPRKPGPLDYDFRAKVKGGAWNVKPIRIPDDSTEGYEAARSEQVARERMSSLEWTTAPANPTKKVDDRYGRPLVHDQYRGVESRDAAKRLVTHSRQALGEASQTEGIDPNQKYSYPMTSLQEIGWRAPSTNNVKTKAI